MDRPKQVSDMLVKDQHLRAYINYTEKQNRELLEENRMLKLKLEELEQQIKDTNKTVRSLFYKQDKENSEPKKLGPPENHEPHNRQMPTLIHRRHTLELHQCPDCGHKLGKPVRTRKRYVEDIKEPEPFNTEYEIPYYWCTECGRQVTVKPADVIPKCRFGIKIMLIATFLRYGLSLPYNKIAKEMAMLCGIAISEGCLVDSIAKFAAFAGPQFEEIKRKVRGLPHVHTDWTGWREAGKNTTLWDFVDDEYSLLIIRHDQSRGMINEVLGEDYDGIVISDCMPATAKLKCRQQKCWVHFLRHARNIDSEQGELLLARLKRIYELAKSGKHSPKHLLGLIDSLNDVGFTEKKCGKVLKMLQKYRDSLFTFVDNPSISDNNNAAERGLRPSVVMRKITGGNRSTKGSHCHEVIMSVMNTWDKQHKDFFAEGAKMVQEELRDLR